LLSNSFQILEFGFPSSACARWHLHTIGCFISFPMNNTHSHTQTNIDYYI